MLQVEHIAKTFGERQVLEDVNLQVNQGDVVVILGPSGSGKTTFLRCLNHLEKADSGRLTLAGKTYDLSKLSKKDILEIRQKNSLCFPTLQSLCKQNCSGKYSRRPNSGS